MQHDQLMSRAIKLAQQGCYTTSPNPNVGCLIVKNGQIIAEGWHQQAGQAHAEKHALNQLTLAQTTGADCYVTLEPCCHTGKTGPCCEALIKAKVKSVYIAMIDPNPRVSGKGIMKLRQAGIEVIVGLLTDEAKKLNLDFIHRMQTGRPKVQSKIAMSLDGRTAMASGESQWITGQAARQDVQRLRAKACAVMTGIGTVLADDPKLTVRSVIDYPDIEVRQPYRVVVDSGLQTPDNAAVLSSKAKTIIATASQKKMADVTVWHCPDESSHRVDLTALLSQLGQHQINQVLVEAGPTLNGALIAAGLIDELILYYSPKILGNNARGAFSIPGLEQLAACCTLSITDMVAVGKDWRITAIPDY